MSNADVIGWTVFLWVIYFRLITIRLVTDVRNGDLIVGMRGLWRSRRVAVRDIQAAEIITFNPTRDYGGYGIRPTRGGKAYIASGNRGVRFTLAAGKNLVVASQRPEELTSAIRASATLP